MFFAIVGALLAAHVIYSLYELIGKAMENRREIELKRIEYQMEALRKGVVLDKKGKVQ